MTAEWVCKHEHDIGVCTGVGCLHATRHTEQVQDYRYIAAHMLFVVCMSVCVLCNVCAHNY